MTVLQDSPPCDQGSAKRDGEGCKIRLGFHPVGTIAVMSVAVVLFAILLCFRSSLKSKTEPVAQVHQGAVRSHARPPTQEIKGDDGKFPKIEKPGQYYDRVLGKWVEDLDLQDEGVRDVIKVVNPDPGGLPNIPYNEATTTDVPVPRGQSPHFIINSGTRIMIPAQFATRRGLLQWSQNPQQYVSNALPMPVAYPNMSHRGSLVNTMMNPYLQVMPRQPMLIVGRVNSATYTIPG